MRSLVNPLKNSSIRKVANPVYSDENDMFPNLSMLNMYAKLSRYIESIKILLYEYSLGNISVVADILTLETYQQISIELNKLSLKGKKYSYYEQLRKNYTYSIAGLYQSIIQYSEREACKNTIEQLREKLSILDDPQKLRDYILKFKSSNYFPDTSLTIIKAEIKPEYLEYIKLYGYPESNVFDPDKLARIILSLGK
jgi:hypothetical protein